LKLEKNNLIQGYHAKKEEASSTKNNIEDVKEKIGPQTNLATSGNGINFKLIKGALELPVKNQKSISTKSKVNAKTPNLTKLSYFILFK